MYARPPHPIYDSFCGVVTQSPGVSTQQNPIHASRALDSVVTRIRASALSGQHKRQVTTAYTLAAEEAQKKDKLAAEEALDRRRHSIFTEVYTLPPAAVNKLIEVRRFKPPAALPPRRVPTGSTETRRAASRRAAAAEAASAACGAPGRRPITAPEGSRSRSVSPDGRAASPPNGRFSPPLARFSARPQTAVSPVTEAPLEADPLGLAGDAAAPRVSPAANFVRWTPPRYTAGHLGSPRAGARGGTVAQAAGGAASASPQDPSLPGPPPQGPPTCAAVDAEEQLAVAPASEVPAGASIDRLEGELAAVIDDADAPGWLSGGDDAAAAEAARAQRVRQRQFKARRVMRSAVQLSLQEVEFTGLSSSSAKVDLAKMARVAVGIKKASEALRASELLSELGEIQLGMMASAGKFRRRSRYAQLHREGSPATCFYILTQGTLQEVCSDGSVRVLRCEGGPHARYVLFGTESLLGKPRASTISALDDCEVLRFSAAELNISKDGAVKVARKVFQAFVEGELASMSVFANLTGKMLRAVVPLFSLEEPAAGATIFAPGMPGDKVYILMHGRVVIMKGALELACLEAEQGQASARPLEQDLPIFGEMAMLDRRPRVASAIAQTGCKLLVLPVEQFAACMLIIPDVKKRLRNLKELRTAQNRVDESRRVDRKRMAAGTSPRVR